MLSVVLTGFLRLYVAALGNGDTVLVLENPHVARSVLEIDGVKLGEVAPLAEVRVGGLADGLHTIAWTTPSGFVRAGPPARSTAPPRAR